MILCRLRLRWLGRNGRSLHCQPPVLQRLVEVGKLENPQPDERYKAGQLFLHRVFGYRGVILLPWTARVFDRDLHGGTVSVSNKEKDLIGQEQLKGLKAEDLSYYQVLIDQRDFPFMRSQPEGITFLADKDNSSLYTVSGLDYVSHEEVLPYTSTDSDEPFRHELFEQFLVPSTDDSKISYVPRDSLRAWQEKNIQWLEWTDVHRETTKGIRVTVIPFYVGYKASSSSNGGGTTTSHVHWWRYNIRLENLVGERVQLRERYWKIYSTSGTLETVKGKGVVGQEPVLTARQPAFQYSSHVSLQSPSGHMWGSYRMERQDGKLFDVRIPPFMLESNRQQHK